jgi:hypothetical protein
VQRTFYGLTFLAGVALAIAAVASAERQLALLLPLFWVPIVFGAYGFLADVWPKPQPKSTGPADPNAPPPKQSKGMTAALIAVGAVARAVPIIALGLILTLGIFYLPLWQVKSRRPLRVALVGCAFFVTPILFITLINVQYRLAS